jgi:DNA polymerase
LFVGEAPGASEDVLGRPFVGPAGKLLDRVIQQSLPEQVRYCITNLVACIPVDDEGQKTIEPPDYAIRACNLRLLEMVDMAHAKLLVAVGKCAAKHLRGVNGPLVEIIHPAAILRMDASQQGLAYQRTLVALDDAVEEYLS